MSNNTERIALDIVPNLLGEYRIDHVQTTDGLVVYQTVTHNGIENTHPLGSLSDLTVEDLLPYTPITFDSDVSKLLSQDEITWDNVNNVIAFGSPLGQWDPITETFKHARELGREAVDDYELDLIGAIYDTCTTIKLIGDQQ